MRAIRFIISAALILCAARAWPAEKTMGVIMSGNIGYYHEVHKTFVKSLAREGYDFHKVDTLLQMPAPDALSWANAARKLVVAEVSLLVTYGAPAALATIGETKSIPIVFAGVYDPPAVGVQARNATGISSKVPMTSLVKYIKKLGSFSRIAVVYNENEPDSVRQMEELGLLEGQYGFQMVKMPVRKSDDAGRLVFTGKADVVLISVSATANEALETIVKLAHASKIPTVSQMGGTAEKGVVLSLSPSPVEQGETAARIAVRLLKGDNPASIPPEMPRMVELVLNLKEAAAVGLKVPFDLITDATRVIK